MCIHFQSFSRGNVFGGILSAELDLIQFWALPGSYLGKIENNSVLCKLFNKLNIPSQKGYPCPLSHECAPSSGPETTWS